MVVVLKKEKNFLLDYFGKGVYYFQLIMIFGNCTFLLKIFTSGVLGWLSQ